MWRKNELYMDNNEISQIKVSVILPSLNVVSYIQECIESVIAQTMQEIEILCIDAGSTDGTLEIIENYALKDVRIRILRSDKKSYGYQLNIGIREAKGQYIGIVETDDYIAPSMYEILYYWAERNNDPDFVKSGYHCFAEIEERKFFYEYNRDRLTELFHSRLNLKENREAGVIDLNHIWSGIYRRDFLLRKNILLHETPGASYQDVSFSLLVGLLADTGVYIKQGYYFYRTDNEHSSVKSVEKWKYVIEEFRYVERELTKRGMWSDEIEGLIWEQKLQIYVWNLLRLSEKERNDFLLEVEQELKTYQEKILYLKHTDKELERYVALLTERAALEHYFIEKQELMEKIEQLSTMVKAGENFVLISAGRYGERILLFQSMLAKTFVQAVADNNAERKGSDWNGYVVLSIEEAVRRYRDNFFIIANKNYSKELQKQLFDLGINQEKIIIFSDMLSMEEIIGWIKKENR